MTKTADAKILMVDSETSWRGGEGQIELLMKGLIETGFDVTLAASADAAITRRAAALGVPCLELSISGDMDLAAAWTLRGYLRENRCDIVHCHSSHAHGVAFLADRASRFGRSGSMKTRPLLVVSRRVDFRVAKNRLSALKYKHGADFYIAISNGVRDALLESGVAEDRIQIVQSGINLNKFAEVRDSRYLLGEFGFTDTTPVIGNVAALAPHKSQSDFILAAKRV
ncbi:MAG: glycosyltransferase, partial [Candidatus Krumholzibacteria bacterium]|nr:glycosyltransferase [Candidatus Krumholzibacteria bacterium]